MGINFHVGQCPVSDRYFKPCYPPFRVTSQILVLCTKKTRVLEATYTVIAVRVSYKKNCTAKSRVICTDPRLAMKSKHFKICALFWTGAGALLGG